MNAPSPLPQCVLVYRIRSVFRRAFFSGFAVLSLLLMLSSARAGNAQAGNAQTGAQAGRAGLITEAVREDHRVVLHGNTHPLATSAADRGVVDASMPAERMLLLLRRSTEQELALRGTIESLHDKNSPNFHKWMTPAQFGAEWGAADSDVAAVTGWLESHGFRIAGISAGRTAIEFSGTAGQVQEAFHTSIHTYFVNGELHHANAKDPEIPAALAPVVAGISRLNDFRLKAMVQKGPRGIFDPSVGKIRKQFTDPLQTDFLYLVPADAATIYNTPNHALNPAYTGATIDGRNAKIGILSDANISKQQVANYRSLFGLSAKVPTVIIDGAEDPGINGDTVEAYLDLEVAGGLAPGANLYLYTAADSSVNFGLDLASLRAVNDNLVDVLNMSFGGCEGGLSTSVNLFYEALWEQAAAQGISVTVSSGDSGSAGCDDPNSQTLAYYGLQVNGLASTPFNIAVGGTDFAPLATNSGFDSYVSQTNAPGTYRSAQSYIPEVPWNDTSFTYPPGTFANAVAAPNPYANIVGAGGGKSNCSAGYVLEDGTLNCQYGYQKPSWQTALTPADKARDIPDVSLFAANGLYGAAWGICTDQDSLSDGTPVKDCTKNSDGLTNGEFYVYGVGGTSASAPAFAGILALLHQSTGERQGLANYVLYNLAHQQQGNSALHYFHDVTSGNNSVPCAKGYPNCKLNSVGANYLTGYNAVAGYDLASGLGSVDATALIAGWASAGLTSTTTQLQLSPTSIQHGQKVVAKATVTTSGGVATGNVALSAVANASTSQPGTAIGTYALTNGTTGNISINDLPGGTYKLIASYGGSEKFSQSVSPSESVTVAAEPSKTVVSFTSYSPDSGQSSTSNKVPYGYGVNFTAHPYGVNSPIVGGVVQPDGVATGTVTFTSGSTNFGTDPLSLLGYALSDGHLLAVGTHAITAAYHGDKSFKPSLGAGTLVINKAATSLVLTASATRYTGTPITFHVTLTTVSAGAAPTGEIRIQRGSVLLIQAPVVGLAANTSRLAEGSVTLSTSNLGVGAGAITATYVGDANYAASTSNGVKVEGRPTFTVGNIDLTLFGEHATGGGFLNVTSQNGYAGTINFTCVLTTKTTTPTPPLCAMYPNTLALSAGRTGQAEILIFGKGSKLPTATQSTSETPSFGLKVGAGGAVLACCLLFGIPARRRGWRTFVSMLLLLAAVSGFTACIAKPKKISAGGYTFRVVGTDSADKTNKATATVKVNVL